MTNYRGIAFTDHGHYSTTEIKYIERLCAYQCRVDGWHCGYFATVAECEDAIRGYAFKYNKVVHYGANTDDTLCKLQ
jgi:hypothetical protein